MRTIETNVYQFDELSEQAKGRARDWYRGDDSGLDYDWWDSTYEDFLAIADILGFSIDPKNVQFSGFWSQGDGASFRGRYQYAPGWKAKLKAYAPLDKELQSIGDALQAAQKRYFYGIAADIGDSHRGFFMSCEPWNCRVSRDGGYSSEETDDTAREDILEAARDLAYWLYNRLESEHEYLTSDESVDETIRANGYEFDERGNRA
jgi:hypothetical protein